MDDDKKTTDRIPTTVEEAVETLISKLSPKKRWEIARMEKKDLVSLHFLMEMNIRREFNLMGGNVELVRSCAKLADKEEIPPETASMVIVVEMWKRLKETHQIKVIK